MFIYYIANLILLSKKPEALKALETYGKYFYDMNLAEANIRRYHALTLVRFNQDNKWESSLKALR